jgi:hypothetical protein
MHAFFHLPALALAIAGLSHAQTFSDYVHVSNIEATAQSQTVSRVPLIKQPWGVKSCKASRRTHIYRI